MLRRLAWSSVPSPSFSATRLNEIIASSRRYNNRNHIRGLLFTGTHFLGILEGQNGTCRTFGRPRAGRRHYDHRIGDVLCGRRWFPNGFGLTDQSDADVQIAALRSRQTPNDRNHDVAGAQIEPLRSPPTQAAQLWAQIIYPIMCAATAFTLHMS
jgi:hypothetical protein